MRSRPDRAPGPGPSSRPALVVALVLYAAFIAYNTLLPFDFAAPAGDLRAEIRTTLAYTGPDRASLTDVVGNLLLFVPFGLLAAALLARVPGTVLLVSIAGAAASLALESAQLWLPARDTALQDLVHNTVGAAAGAFAAVIAARLARGRLGEAGARLLHHQPLAACLVAILAARAVAAAMPFTVVIAVSDIARNAKAANLVPFDYRSLGALLGRAPNALDRAGFDAAAMAEQVLAWIPVGALAAAAFARHWRWRPHAWWAAAAAVALYFAGLEAMQLFVVTRIVDVNNLIAGYAGVGLGALAHLAFARGRRANDRAALELAVAPVALYLVYLLFAGLRPFDFTLEPAVLAEGFALEHLVPFGAYFRTTRLANLADFAAALAYFVPVAFYLAARLHLAGAGATHLYVATLAAGLGSGAAIELAQAFSPSRVGDVTDALAFAVGGWLGAYGVRWYVRAHGVRPRRDVRSP